MQKDKKNKYLCSCGQPGEVQRPTGEYNCWWCWLGEEECKKKFNTELFQKMKKYQNEK